MPDELDTLVEPVSMSPWVAIILVGIVLATDARRAAAEDDPFGPPPPLPPEIDVPVLTLPTPRPAPPVEPTVIKPRPVASPKEPTPAEQRVHERAAAAARERKARIQQRKQSPVVAVPTFFPATGPLSDPALFKNDRGIEIAFRPIVLSGLEPLPNLRPSPASGKHSVRRSLPKTDTERPAPPVRE